MEGGTSMTEAGFGLHSTNVTRCCSSGPDPCSPKPELYGDGAGAQGGQRSTSQRTPAERADDLSGGAVAGIACGMLQPSHYDELSSLALAQCRHCAPAMQVNGTALCCSGAVCCCNALCKLVVCLQFGCFSAGACARSCAGQRCTCPKRSMLGHRWHHCASQCFCHDAQCFSHDACRGSRSCTAGHLPGSGVLQAPPAALQACASQIGLVALCHNS